MKAAVQTSGLTASCLPLQRGVRVARAQRVSVRVAASTNAVQDAIVKSATFATLAGSFLAAGNAQAAMEVADLAAGDGRAALLLIPLGAALGWVGFNIGGPALNQISKMSDKKKGIVAGLGLGAASLMASPSADAATEAMQLAGGDGRAALLLIPLGAALGWVGFNIAGPALNQLSAMDKTKK